MGERVFVYMPKEKANKDYKFARPFHGPFEVLETGVIVRPVGREYLGCLEQDTLLPTCHSIGCILTGKEALQAVYSTEKHKEPETQRTKQAEISTCNPGSSGAHDCMEDPGRLRGGRG